MRSRARARIRWLLTLHRDHLQLDPCADIQRRHLNVGSRRRIGRKVFAIYRVELIEVLEVGDESGHGHDVFEVHSGVRENLTDIRQRLARLALDPTGCQPGAYGSRPV